GSGPTPGATARDTGAPAGVPAGGRRRAAGTPAVVAVRPPALDAAPGPAALRHRTIDLRHHTIDLRHRNPARTADPALGGTRAGAPGPVDAGRLPASRGGRPAIQWVPAIQRVP